MKTRAEPAVPTVGTMSQPAEPSHKSSIKETLISITIAFVLAFVFRGFVMEAFQIPTGSMAPTLLGQHMRFVGPETGVNWAAGPRDFADPGSMQVALGRQGVGDPIRVSDPMLRADGPLTASSVPRKAGDRIFVLKYLYSVFDPSRFDVVVFKNPSDPQQNFIKRLIGLPGEQLALVAGDLFARPSADALKDPPDDANAAWGGSTWRIQRKPERVQRSTWQTLFDSRFTPLSALAGRTPFRPPWTPTGAGWDMAGKAQYAYSGSQPTGLTWDNQRRPVEDYYAYNEVRPRGPNGREAPAEPPYPVPDVAVSFGLTSTQAPAFAVVVEATGHEFRARVSSDGQVLLTMTPLPRVTGEPVVEREIGRGNFKRTNGRPLDVEVWHADQAVTVFIDGKRVARGEYDLTPSQRVLLATGSPLDELTAETHRTGVNQLANPARYRRTGVRIEFLGGPFTVDRVALKRDLYWTPIDRPGRYARASHPEAPCVLGPDQFFVCGDNSPASEDGRMWLGVDPWVARQIDPTVGVVPRPLLIGKTFFVYWPSAEWKRGVPVPDFGRMRWVW